MIVLTEELIRRRATLMDDPYMADFFRDNIPCTQLVLRIIMDKPDLIVKKVDVQYTLRSAEGTRYVRLDVYAVDSKGTHYDIEVQNDSAGASPYRSRLNSALLDANILKSGEDVSLLKERESVVIFITDKDVLKGGEPIYIIDRVIEKSGRKFGDGSHIVYVNSSHQDLDTALGRLMHDFKCDKPEEMFYSEISDRVEDMRGVMKMGLWQEIKEEAIAEGEARGKAIASENIASNLIKAGQVALDEIASACGLTLQRVKELAASIS